MSVRREIDRTGRRDACGIRLGRLVLLALAAILAGCGARDSPEQQVRAVIEQLEIAAESRDVGDLMQHVSMSYHDAHGQRRDEAARYVRGYFIANQSIHLLTRVERLELASADEAQVTLLVGMVGREADASAAWNLVADRYRMELTLVREDGEWQVAYAQWQRH